ncbi:spore coat U domain-containing protein [Janthinobacterium sp. Mn2066]|uniref:Csu type fimbrial protein n=1 Tax=Janthinobacterium sp. Mn2066 TaxID=3395264 RepID=UPI003BC77638
MLPLRIKLSHLSAVSALALFGATAAIPVGAAVYSTGTSTGPFDVTLKIVANCTISAAPLDFGQTQGLLSTPLNVNTTVSVTCTNTTPYNVGLNAGTGTGSTITTRNLSSSTSGNTGVVQFNLYQTAGATNWGNTQGTDTVSGVGSGSAQAITVYGNIPAQNTPAPDTYKSTITATVYF